MISISSKLVYIRNHKQFAGLELKEGYFDNIRHCTLSYLYDVIEMSGLVSARPVVVSPQIMVGNHPLHGLGSQQPRQKDHKTFTKSDAYHIQVQISSYCDESLEYHRSLELEVTIRGIPTICLIDSGSTHNFIDKKRLISQDYEQLQLKLEIVLADGSKITVDKVCYVPIQFCKQVRQAVFCYIIENLSSSLILGMQWLKILTLLCDGQRIRLIYSMGSLQ